MDLSSIFYSGFDFYLLSFTDRIDDLNDPKLANIDHMKSVNLSI